MTDGTGPHDTDPDHDPDQDPDHDSDEPAFRSAEQWLANRGVERRPIRVVAPTSDAAGAPAAGTGPPPSARETVRLATEAPPPAAAPREDAGDDPGDDAAGEGHEPAPLSDEVSRAMAFIRRSTANTPASSGRLRRKLADRGVPAAAVRLALEDAAATGMVDDEALAAALADEARAKGHADTRIRRDLRKREFDDDVVEATLARHADRDPEALAFDVANRKARSLRGLDAEKAFRRLVGHLARRGHNEHIARKVARQVVFNDREDDRTTGH